MHCSEGELAYRLAQKTYDEKFLRLAERRLRQMRCFTEEYQDNEIEAIYEREHVERQRLIKPAEQPWKLRLEQWMQEKYEGKGFKEGEPEIYSERGERVRSKSEKILADYFYRNNICYQYEKPLQLKGYGIVYPDFTFLSMNIQLQNQMETSIIRENMELGISKIYLWEKILMTKVNFYDEADDALLKFAVILAKNKGRWVFCKHRERETWEAPGGHRESGEDILDTARRELYEETGALDYDIKPVCAYSVIAPDNFDGNETFGMLYYADIYRLEDELHSEIEEISIMEGLPDSWTYPEIQPKLLEEAERRGIFKADYDAVVFDMDGVIFDSERAVLNCWIQLADRYGIENIEKSYFACTGTTMARTREIMLETYGEDFPYDAYAKEASSLYHEKYDGGKLPMKPGVINLLTFLKKENKSIALASSTRRVTVINQLRDANILKYFDAVVCCQTAHCGRRKPHFDFGGNTSPIVPYRHLPQILRGMTADCRSLV